MVAASSADAATAFLEIGAVALVLAVLARIAGRFGFTAIPLYLLAGLAVGEGGVLPLDVSHDFIARVADIGVLLLLLTLGLEYSAPELRAGMRTGWPAGLIDGALCFPPGLVVGLALGWSPIAAVLLGGVTWVSSSGIVAKVLADLRRLDDPVTPPILDLLVIEDLAMAVYLPVASALVVQRALTTTVSTIGIALAAIAVIVILAVRFGDRLSAALAGSSDEALLLAVFGLTLLVGGLAQRVEVSAAIGAFFVGLALSGPVRERAGAIISPLRDLSAAVFFVFFSFQIDPSSLVGALAPALALAIAGIAAKVVVGSFTARRAGLDPSRRRLAGGALSARGEFSIVIASLGATLHDGGDLGAVAAAFVLVTAIVGPLLARSASSRIS